MKKILALFVFCAMFINGCMFIPDKPAKVQGSGNVVSETREVSGITSISLEGSADVNVKFGTEESLVIKGEDNIIFLIETNVQNHKLIIKTKPLMTYTATQPVVVNVTVTSLNGVSISGSGNIAVSGYSGDSLTLSLPGSGNIIADGSANNVQITLGGSGNIYADKVTAKTATVVLNGSGNVRVFASDTLNASISGTGNIQYAGHPANVTKNVSGSGTIQE